MARLPRRALVLALLAVAVGVGFELWRRGVWGRPRDSQPQGAGSGAIPRLAPGLATTSESAEREGPTLDPGDGTPPARDSEAPTDLDSSGLVELRGVVVDEKDAPLAGVLVEPEGAPPARSGPDGRFSFRGRASGVPVRACGEGSVLQGRTQLVSASNEARLVMLPARRLRVRVVEPLGRRPVAGAFVRVVPGPHDDGEPGFEWFDWDSESRERDRRWDVGSGDGFTDADGACEVAIEREAELGATLLVSAPGSGVEVRLLDAAALTRGEVEVALGTGRITGIARNVDGSPARTPLRLERWVVDAMEAGVRVVPDSTGRFEFTDLPSASFLLGTGSGEHVLRPNACVTPGDADLEVIVSTPEDRSRHSLLLFCVDGATGKGVPWEGASLMEFSPVDRSSAPIRNSERRGDPPPWGLTIPIGYQPVPPGSYDVTVTVQGWRPVRLSAIRIPSDDKPRTVRLDRGVPLTGVVRFPDGNAAGGVLVRVGEQEGHTSGAGHFSLTGLEVGSSAVTLVGERILEWRSTVVLRSEAGAVVEWTVEPAGIVQVGLPPATVASGVERVRVTPSGGTPLDRREDGPLLRGAFHGARFGGLVPGRYRVEAWQGATEWPARDVDVRAGEVTTVRFSAEPAGTAPK